MELDADDGTSTRSGSQTVRKNIPLKLKVSKGRGKKGRGRKGSRKAEKQHEEDEDITEEKVLDLPNLKPEPFFCAPKICWEHKVTLIGEKVVDPLIHCCEKCDLPILVYGRMIPCKHVFCLDCAKRTEKYCQRCSDPVSRIEQSALGTVFICTSGGSKHGVSGCRRTYLSQRDLQAHINYRHLGRQAEPRHGDTRAMEYLPQPSNMPIPPGLQLLPPPPPNFRVEDGSHMQSHLPPPPPQQGHLPPPPPQQGHPPLTAPPAQTHLPAPPTSSHIESYHTIPVMSTNLITVQIQEEDFQRRDQGGNYLPAPGPGPFSQSQSPTRSAPPPGVPPPLPYPPSLSSPPPVSFAPYSSGGLPPHSHPHMGPPPGQRPPLLTQPPPMVSHPGGPPPPRPVPPVSSHGPIPSSHPPSNYPSPHHHDPPPSFSQPGQPDNHGPSHWSGAAPGGPPAAQPRPPPPTRTATSSAGGMGQPPPGSYYQ